MSLKRLQQKYYNSRENCVEELRNLCSSTDIIMMIKSRKLDGLDMQHSCNIIKTLATVIQKQMSHV
jgi:ABC-type enterochelin transport system ATPase subunit